MKSLNVSDVVRIHAKVIAASGGSLGVRDIARLQSTVASVHQHVYGQELYQSLYEKAAVLMRNIIDDHPFVDGNKRTAVIVCLTFLTLNGVNAKHIDQKELEDFAVCVATDHLSIPEIANWLKHHAD